MKVPPKIQIPPPVIPAAPAPAPPPQIVYVLQQPAKRRTSVATWLVLLLAVAAVGMAIVALTAIALETPAQRAQRQREQAAEQKGIDESMERSAAYFQGVRFCRDRLKSPSTAKFSGLLWDAGECGARRLEGTNNLWSVWGFVDSQNSFGATLREKWEATLLHTNEQWDLVSLQFYE